MELYVNIMFGVMVFILGGILIIRLKETSKERKEHALERKEHALELREHRGILERHAKLLEQLEPAFREFSLSFAGKKVRLNNIELTQRKFDSRLHVVENNLDALRLSHAANHASAIEQKRKATIITGNNNRVNADMENTGLTFNENTQTDFSK